MVPNSRSPLRAAFLAPGTFSRIQTILVAEKKVASGNPVFARKRSIPPLFAMASTMSWVLVSCQTMALYTGVPVWRFQTKVVSLWFVIPSAAMECLVMLARLRAWPTASLALSQICMASCSTKPACGMICLCSSWPTEIASPSWLKTMALVLVVP